MDFRASNLQKCKRINLCVVLSYFVMICYKNNRKIIQILWVLRSVGYSSLKSGEQSNIGVWCLETRWLNLESHQHWAGTGSSEVRGNHMDGNVEWREKSSQTESGGTSTFKSGRQQIKLVSSPWSGRKGRTMRGQGKLREENILTTRIWLIISVNPRRN